IWDNFMGTIGKIGDYMKGGANWLLGGMGMFDDNEELKEQVKEAPKAADPAPVVKGKELAKGGQVKPVAPVTQNSYKTEAQIVVHAAPGMDEKALAREISRQLDERDRRAQQQDRARNKD
ncbi:MAG: hypothetical protein ACRCUF_16860, partial [Aeromonas sobria]